MSLSNIVIGIVAVASLAIGVTNLTPVEPAQEPVLGAFPGPDVLEQLFLRGGMTVGGNNLATTSAGASTLTAAQLGNNSTITYTATGALTLSMPASSTLSGFIPKTGDRKTVWLLPVTTGITVANGTGVDVNTASSTKFCVASQVCEIEFVRKSNSDIEALLTNSSGI